MSLSKRWKLSATGLSAFALLTVLIVRPGFTGRRPDEAADEKWGTVLNGHRFPVQALAFSPDGSTLVSGSCYINAPGSGLEVAAWDVATGTRLARRTEQLEVLLNLAFAPGGKRLVAAEGSSLRLWDTTQAQDQGQRFERPEAVWDLAFSDDGRQLAVADLANDVTLLDAASGQPRACCKGQDEAVHCLAFSPDGVVLASGGRKGTVRLWDAASGEERGVLRGHAGIVVAVAFAPDGRTLASGDARGAVKLWDVAAGTARSTLEPAEDEVDTKAVAALAFSPDGRRLAVAIGREVQLWNVVPRNLMARLAGHEGWVTCLAYSPDGTRLASGGFDKTVRLWDVTRY
jgi:WD40 repeat protein